MIANNQSASGKSIASVCDAVLTANVQNCQADCSGFVKQVASRLNVILPDVLANELVAFLGNAAGWQRLQNNAKLASLYAAQNMFVIAGLKEPGNGHVAVVVPGWSPQGFPMGYWGTIRGAQYAGFNASLSKSFTRAQLQIVSYYAKPISPLTS